MSLLCCYRLRSRHHLHYANTFSIITSYKLIYFLLKIFEFKTLIQNNNNYNNISVSMSKWTWIRRWVRGCLGIPDLSHPRNWQLALIPAPFHIIPDNHGLILVDSWALLNKWIPLLWQDEGGACPATLQYDSSILQTRNYNVQNEWSDDKLNYF